MRRVRGDFDQEKKRVLHRQRVANVASSLSTVSGTATLIATGNAEDGATASDIEGVVVTATAGAAYLNGLEKGADISGPSAADLTAAGQSAVNLLGATNPSVAAGATTCQ